MERGRQRQRERGRERERERGRGDSLVSLLIRALILPRGPHSHDLKPNYLTKVPPSNTDALGGKFQYKFAGIQTFSQ